MKRLLPGRVELAVLTALALLCTLIAGLFEQRDAALALAAVPLFITAAVMGLRRNWQESSSSSRRREPAE